MNGRKTLLLLAILAGGSSTEVAWRLRTLGVNTEGCWLLPGTLRGPAVTVDSEKSVPLPAGAKVSVDNPFGRVTVKKGEGKGVEVALQSVVYLRDETQARAVASQVEVETRLEGGTLRIGTNRDSLERQGRLAGTGLETHLEVRVPEKTSVEVKSEHGNVVVSDVAAATLDTGFGDVQLSGVAGPAGLVSRHGDVAVSDVQGPLTLESQFGDVTVGRATGTTSLKVDHGDLTLDHAGASNVQLRNGDLKANDIQGAFDFDGEHAGVDLSSVKARCSIASSYRDIEVHDVQGDLKVKTEHGGLVASEIQGAVEAEVNFDDVKLSSVHGAVQVTVTHGGFKGEGLDKGARLNVSGDDVALEGFKGPVEVSASRGSVELKPSGPIEDAVSVTTTNGGISLEVPKGSRFDLDATVSSGDLSVASLPEFVRTLASPSRITGRLGGGGTTVHLQASQGDVNVEAQEKD